MLPFVGNGNQKELTKNPCHFTMRNSQANSKKKSTKVFWRAGKAKKSQGGSGLLPKKSGERPWGCYRDKFLPNYFRGMVRAPPLPQKKVLLPERDSYQNRFQWNYFLGSCWTFWQEPWGTCRGNLFSNYFGHHFAGGGGGGYMREIGTMWQIGVFAGKPCTFVLKNGSFRRVRTIKTRREFRVVST